MRPSKITFQVGNPALRENVLMVTLGYGILVTVVDLRVLVTLFYSMEL